MYRLWDGCRVYVELVSGFAAVVFGFSTWVVVKIRVPFLGTLNNRCRIIIGSQKGTIILTTTHTLTQSLVYAAHIEEHFVLKQRVIGTLRGVGGRGVGGLNAHNKDLIRLI